MHERLAELVPVLTLMNDQAIANLARTSARIQAHQQELKDLSHKFRAARPASWEQTAGLLMSLRQGERWVQAETIRINQEIATLRALAEEQKNVLRTAAGRLDAAQGILSTERRSGS